MCVNTNILERDWKREVVEDENKKNFKVLEESDLSKFDRKWSFISVFN